MRLRSLLGLLLALAGLFVLGQGDLALTFAPALLIVGLPLLGCFPGERAIIAHRLRSAARRLRPAKVRWGRRRAAAPLVSMLARLPLSLRGPPSAA